MPDESGNLGSEIQLSGVDTALDQIAARQLSPSGGTQPAAQDQVDAAAGLPSEPSPAARRRYTSNRERAASRGMSATPDDHLADALGASRATAPTIAPAPTYTPFTGVRYTPDLSPPPVASPSSSRLYVEDPRTTRYWADVQAQEEARLTQARAAERADLANKLSPFEQFNEHKQYAERELQDLYVSSGRGGDIGSAAFRADLQTQLVENGWIEYSPPAAARKPKGHADGGLAGLLSSMDMAYAYAYGGMSTLSGIQRATQPIVAGQAYLPGQVAEQVETSFLPAAGAILGTVAGIRLGGAAGGIAGQFLGQAEGQAIQGGLDTYFEGHTYAAQRAGQSIGAGRGVGAADAFADAIQRVTASTKDLADVFEGLARRTPIGLGGGNATGFAQSYADLENTYGTAAKRIAGDLFSGLSSVPGFAATEANAAAGGMTPLDAQAYEGVFAAGGDYQSFLAARAASGSAYANRTPEGQAAIRARLGRDREYQRAEGWFSSGLGQFFAPSTYGGGRLGRVLGDLAGVPFLGIPTFLNEHYRGVEAREAQRARAAVAAADPDALSDAEFIELAQSRSEFSTSTAQSQSLRSGLELTLARGGSSADIAAWLPQARTADSSAAIAGRATITRLQPTIDRLQARIASGRLSPSEIQDATSALDPLLEIVAKTQTGVNAAEMDLATGTRMLATTRVSEAEASFGASQSVISERISRRVAGGASMADLAGDYGTLEAGERAYGRRLRDLENQPGLSPADRDRMTKEASDAVAQSIATAMQYTVQAVQQQVTGLTLGVQQAGVAATYSSLYGTPDEALAGAQGRIGARGREISGLQNILARPDLPFGLRQQLEGTLAGERGQQIEDEFASRATYFANTRTVRVAGAEAAGIDLQIARTTSGTADLGAGYTATASTYDAQSLTDDANARFYAPGTMARAGWERQAAADRLAAQQARIARGDYEPSPGIQLSLTRASGTLARLNMTFAQDGDITTARGDMLRAQEAELADIARQQRGLDPQSREYANLEGTRQQVLTDIARTRSETMLDWSHQWPSTMIGGGSFVRRVTPSDMDTAWRLANTGHENLGAFSFGFFHGPAFNQALAAAGGMSTAGKSIPDLFPGNHSAAALAGAAPIVNVTVQIDGRDIPAKSTTTTTARQGTPTTNRSLNGRTPGGRG